MTNDETASSLAEAAQNRREKAEEKSKNAGNLQERIEALEEAMGWR